jgi:hypothetical protein
MWLTLDDLRCPACGAFVHPLLDACPTCGAAHQSQREEAAVGPIGAVRLEEAAETLRLAQNLTLRYTIKVNAIGHSEPNATLLSAVAHLADALTYRISGDAVPTTEDASRVLRDGSVLAKGRPSGSLVAEIPLSVIVGSASGHGEVTLHYAAGSTPARAAGVAALPGSTGLQRMTVSNRRGLLASKARDEHFENLARWLGVLAAAAAERRWMEVGLPAYLAELGPAVGGPVDSAAVASPRLDDTAPSSAIGPIPVSSGPPLAKPAPASVQASLVELESLRTAGLVADDEYAAKRQEILARL